MNKYRINYLFAVLVILLSRPPVIVVAQDDDLGLFYGADGITYTNSIPPDDCPSD